MREFLQKDIDGFLEALGLDEGPLGMHYTDRQPAEGLSPGKVALPSVQQEAKGEVDFGSLFGNFSCVIGNMSTRRYT